VDASLAIGTALPSADAAVQRALDQARHQRRDLAEVECLASMSLGLSSLAAAGRGGAKLDRAVALARLEALSRQWLERLPMQ